MRAFSTFFAQKVHWLKPISLTKTTFFRAEKSRKKPLFFCIFWQNFLKIREKWKWKTKSFAPIFLFFLNIFIKFRKNRKKYGRASKRNLTFNLLDPDQIRLTLCYTDYFSLEFHSLCRISCTIGRFFTKL